MSCSVVQVRALVDQASSQLHSDSLGCPVSAAGRETLAVQEWKEWREKMTDQEQQHGCWKLRGEREGREDMCVCVCV